MTSLSLVPDWLREYQECIDSQINLQFAEVHSTLEADAFETVAGGKRLRAVLSLLWCEALSGDYKKASEIAAAYELAQTAALIQDDVIDKSAIKHGEPSIPAKHGIAGAILSANALLFLVPKLISEFGRKSGDAELISRLLDLFGECYRSSSLGEYMDLEMAKSRSVSESGYEEMISLKTGSLIGAASASGALIGLGRYDSKIVSAAYDYGASLGIAYQIQDDILDIFGNESVIGKPIFNDITNGKKSLMIIRFLNVCDVGSELEFVENVLKIKGRPITEEEIGRTRELLLKYGCESYAKKFADRKIRQAADSLQVLNSSIAKDRLLDISSLVSARNY
jgi:geranylgeranyl diphosphate synthase, type I